MKMSIIIILLVAAIACGFVYLQGAFHWYTVPIQLIAATVGVLVGRGLSGRLFR